MKHYAVTRVSEGPSNDFRLVYLVDESGEVWVVLSLRSDLPPVNEVVTDETDGVEAIRRRGWGGPFKLSALRDGQPRMPE